MSVAALLVTGHARAGGFEMPDNGSEALGRGGAFTAKADDPTAIEYNVAGLASQKGTHVLLDAHTIESAYGFQRAGAYPGNPQDPSTPWAGQDFPRVTSRSTLFPAPMFVVTSDLGLPHFTFAVGAYGPSGVPDRTYPLGVNGAPSPGRYDTVQSKSIIALPTAAMGWRVAPGLDLGLAVHAVTAIVDELSVSTFDPSTTLCPSPEYHPCDTEGHLKATGLAPAASLGVMVRPRPWLALGLGVRSAATIVAHGTVSSVAPEVAPAPVAPGTAQVTTHLPWIVRAGARLIAHEGSFETGDVEVDATYEAWHAAEGDGTHLVVSEPTLSSSGNINEILIHHYRDTFSVRVGGARNFHALGGIVTLRAGGYYDSSATAPADTRLDFDTLEKLAATVGAGFHIGAWTVNLAYAEIFSPDRVVTRGDFRPSNVAMNGQTVAPSGQPLPAVNEGAYASHNRILSVGLQWSFDGTRE